MSLAVNLYVYRDEPSLSILCLHFLTTMRRYHSRFQMILMCILYVRIKMINNIQLLRALAVMMVVLYHSSGTLNTYDLIL